MREDARIPPEGAGSRSLFAGIPRQLSYDSHLQPRFFPLSIPVTFPAPSGSEVPTSFPWWRARTRKKLSTCPAAQHLGNCGPSVPSGDKT